LQTSRFALTTALFFALASRALSRRSSPCMHALTTAPHPPLPLPRCACAPQPSKRFNHSSRSSL
jgi:hypothetical protein